MHAKFYMHFAILRIVDVKHSLSEMQYSTEESLLSAYEQVRSPPKRESCSYGARRISVQYVHWYTWYRKDSSHRCTWFRVDSSEFNKR